MTAEKSQRNQPWCIYILTIFSTHLKVGLFRIFSYILVIGAVTFIFSNSVYQTVELNNSVNYNQKHFVDSKPLIHGRTEELHHPTKSTSNRSGIFSTVVHQVLHQTWNKSLSNFYEQLGANVTFTSNPQLLKDLCSSTYVNFSREVRKVSDIVTKERIPKSLALGRISLKYASFSQHEPNFMTEKDKDLFFMFKANSYALLPPSDAQLSGNIEILYLGKASERLDCGWKNKLTDYYVEDSSALAKVANKFLQSPSELIVPLLVPDGWSFQHFTDGILPKLAQIAPFLSHPQVKVMLRNPRDSIIVEMLEKVGIDQSRIVHYDSGEKTLGYQLNTCITPPLHPGLWSKMRNLLGVGTSLQVPMAEASVILLTRARTRNGGRKILNLHEIILYLRTRYNTTLSVFQSGHNLAQNQAFFGKARLVIGVHGGAFYNINFCPSETIVAEYVPLSEHNTSFEGSASRIVWFMANMNGQRYYRLAEKPISGNNLQISVQKLKTLLDEVDKIQLKTSS